MRHDPLCNFESSTNQAGVPWAEVEAYRHDLATWHPIIEAHGWQPIADYDGKSAALVRSPLKWIFGVLVDEVWHDMRGGDLEPLPEFHPIEFVPVTYEQGEAIFLHVPAPKATPPELVAPTDSRSLFEVMMGMSAEEWDAAAGVERDFGRG